MLKLWQVLSVITLAVAVVAKADPIHFDQVNGAMKVIADYVVQGDDMVDWARPEFDTQYTDLKAEKIRYYLKGSLKNSPWLLGSPSEVKASSMLVADRNVGHMGIAVNSTVEVKTEVLPMLRHGATIALTKISGPPPKFAARIRDTIQQMSTANSLQTVYEILVASQNLGAEVLEDKIQREREYLNCIKEKKCGEGSSISIEEQVANQERYIHQYELRKLAFEQTQIVPLPSATQVLKLVIKNSQSTDWIGGYKWAVEPKVAVLELDEKSVKFSADGFAPLAKEDLDRLKGNLTECAAKLQSGDLQMKEDTFRAFRDALFHFKEVVNGDWPRR